MYCAKCGKEIPDGEKKFCEECEPKVEEVVTPEETKEEKVEVKEKKVKEKKVKEKKVKEEKVKEEKTETKDDWKVSGAKKQKSQLGPILVCIVVLACIVGLVVAACMTLMSSKNTVGNSIGNVRNYGYATENNGWIYYLAPNEDSTEIGIFKIKNNGREKQQQLYMSELDIVSLNVYKGYIYFLGADTETYKVDDELDNKIYRMTVDGTDMEILNDNEVNNDCYEIYVVNDYVYYIGLNAEVCRMDLDGSNKTVISDNGTGFLGITEDYIIYNKAESEDSEDYVTYIMNVDGVDAKPIIEGKRLYSVNIEDNYVYYSNTEKHLYRTEIGSNKEELLYEEEMYNLNTNDGYAYYLGYADVKNSDYTVCLFRVKLDGTSETPEKIKALETYSSFLDVVGDWVIYMDSGAEAGFIKLVNKEGTGEEIEVYRLDYASYYENLDFSDTAVDATNGSTDTSTDATQTTQPADAKTTTDATQTTQQTDTKTTTDATKTN